MHLRAAKPDIRVEPQPYGKCKATMGRMYQALHNSRPLYKPECGKKTTTSIWKSSSNSGIFPIWTGQNVHLCTAVSVRGSHEYCPSKYYIRLSCLLPSYNNRYYSVTGSLNTAGNLLTASHIHRTIISPFLGASPYTRLLDLTDSHHRTPVQKV